MSLIKLTNTGTWWLKSKQDPRWNISGSTQVGGLIEPEPIKEWVKLFTEKYGEPPKDLEWGYMKD